MTRIDREEPASGLTRLRGPKPYSYALPVITSAGEGLRVAASPQSYTGQYLKQVLKRRSARAKRPAEAAE